MPSIVSSHEFEIPSSARLVRLFSPVTHQTGADNSATLSCVPDLAKFRYREAADRTFQSIRYGLVIVVSKLSAPQGCLMSEDVAIQWLELRSSDNQPVVPDVSIPLPRGVKRITLTALLVPGRYSHYVDAWQSDLGRSDREYPSLIDPSGRLIAATCRFNASEALVAGNQLVVLIRR